MSRKKKMRKKGSEVGERNEEKREGVTLFEQKKIRV